MARFELNGAPKKETPGAVGDICTDTLTMKKYKLSSITKRYAYGKSHIEYHWVDFNDVESLSDRIEVLEQGGISEEAAERIIAEKMNEMGSLTVDQINALIDDKANVSDIQTINDEIDEINEKLENFDGNIDLTDYAKVEDVYTKDQIDAKGYLTEIPDNYTTTDDLNLKANVDEVYSIDEIDAKGFLTEIPDEYVTNDELDLKANAADVYTKAEIDAMGALTEIPEEYITEDELTAKGYATQDDLLLKADADKVYTKEEIDTMGALTEIPDEYITEDELTAKGYATQDDLLLKADADKVYTKEEIDAMGALTEIPDEYITETELADMGLATETFVTTKIAEAALEGSDVDLSGYATKDDLLLKADADKVYTKEEIDAMGYLTEIPDTYATKDDLLLKADADKVYTKDEIDAMGALTEIPEEYITEEELEAKGYATQDDLLLKADADKVYTKDEIDAMGALGEIPEEYITEEELEAKGYATQDDLLLKADADKVYTKDEIDNKGYLTELPDDMVTSKKYCTVAHLNEEKGTNIQLVFGIDNTLTIFNALGPYEEYVDWFNNADGYNRFGISPNDGSRIDYLSIQKLKSNNSGMAFAMTNNGKVFSRVITNGTLSNWTTQNQIDLTEINTKLAQLENTVYQVSGGIHSSGEVEVGKWVDGQTLYRVTISDSTEQTFSSVTMMIDFFTLSRNEYVVVKLDGTFRMCAATDNSGAYTIYALPYVDLDADRQVQLVYTTQDKVGLSCKNLTDYKILGYDVSIYYYKK